MAVRSKVFAHRSSKWGGAAIGVGAASAAALAAFGQSEIALALLAAGGAASGVLFAAGQLHSGRPGSADDRLLQILGVLPAAVAVTDRKGSVLWKSDAFHAGLGGIEHGKDLSRLGDGNPETAAAVFRLFAAARGGMAHEETIVPPHAKNGERVLLKIRPFLERGKRAEFFIWQAEQVKGADEAGAQGGRFLDSLPLPALLIAKDLSVEAASESFAKLTGGLPLGAQAWTLFRTRRGRPFTRAWLRDVIAKAGEPVGVQIVNANGTAQPGFLYTGAGGGDAVLCLVTPAAAAGTLDETFEALLARAPQPMALTSPKGVIQAVNDAFRDLFLGAAKDAAAATELCGKSLALLVGEASSQNVRDRIAGLSANGGLQGPIEMQAVLKGPESGACALLSSRRPAGPILSFRPWQAGRRRPWTKRGLKARSCRRWENSRAVSRTTSTTF